MPPKVSDAAPGSAGQPTPATVVQLSPEQFGKIVELLTPGYELAKWYLDDMQRQKEAHERRTAEEAAADAKAKEDAEAAAKKAAEPAA